LGAAEHLANLKQTLLKGKKIDLLKAEPPLTPAVVLGYDDATRLNSKIILLIIILRV
jgi:hypothetical protein